MREVQRVALKEEVKEFKARVRQEEMDRELAKGLTDTPEKEARMSLECEAAGQILAEKEDEKFIDDEHREDEGSLGSLDQLKCPVNKLEFKLNKTGNNIVPRTATVKRANKTHDHYGYLYKQCGVCKEFFAKNFARHCRD